MDTEFRRAANITITVAGIALLFWIIFKYALGALMPFLLAAAIAALTAPTAKKLSKKTKIPIKVTSATLVLFIFAAVSAALYLAISRLVLEVGNLLQHLSDNPEIVSNTVDAFIDKITQGGSKFSFLQRILESEAFERLEINLDEILGDALQSIISSLTSSIPAAVSLVAKIPSALLFIAVLLISAFYFSVDRETISSGLLSILPQRWQDKLPHVKDRISKTLAGYLKAYLLIMFMTFLEVFVGLSILRVNYAFIVAVIVAIVDVLPVLGTGTVLIPWAIYAFLTSDVRLGVGLLILYAVTLVIRQFAEPKIVGSTLGLHPLATLASVYLGLKFLGVAGIFLGPIAALLIKEALWSDDKKPHSVQVFEKTQ